MLSALRRSLKQTAPVPVANPSVEAVSSLVVPLLFRGLDQVDGLSVLDLGAASSAKLGFFSDRKCRIEFVDLLSELDPSLLTADTEPQVLRQALESLLCNNVTRPIDIVLFWDVLNYLPPTALTILHECLATQLHKDSRAHSFGVRHAHTQIPWSEHEFGAKNSIVSKPKATVPWLATPHTPAELNRQLPSLSVDRTILLRDGRLEMLLVAKGNNDAPTTT